MNEPKFTPGPWRHDRLGIYIFGQSKGGSRLTEKEFTVAEVKEYPVALIRGWGHLQYLGEDEAEAIQVANGNLIATAPDLYEACMAFLESYNLTNSDTATFFKCRQHAVELAELATRKARGEA